MGKLIINTDTCTIVDHLKSPVQYGLDGPLVYQRYTEHCENEIGIEYSKKFEYEYNDLKVLDILIEKLNKTRINFLELRNGCVDTEHFGPKIVPCSKPNIDYPHTCPSCKKETTYRCHYV